MNSYINNLETNKIELHFEKSEYMSLPDNLKQELRRHFLFSKSIPAWVSRSTQNHYWAIETAKKLGFTEEVKKGTRLSYAEQLERKAERAEVRAERYDTYSENASKRGDQLQSTFKSFHGDISFFLSLILTVQEVELLLISGIGFLKGMGKVLRNTEKVNTLKIRPLLLEQRQIWYNLKTRYTWTIELRNAMQR